MSLPAENLEQYDPDDSPSPPAAEPVHDWLEGRIVAVFVAVVATLVLIVAWKVFTQLGG